MDKKTFNEKIAVYNKRIKELQQETKSVTTNEAMQEINMRIKEVLAEKINTEKEQLNDLAKIEKARIAKATQGVSNRLKKERDHRLYTMGGEIEKQLGRMDDVELFKRIQVFLQSEYFKNCHDNYLINQVEIQASELAQAKAKVVAEAQAKQLENNQAHEQGQAPSEVFDDDLPFGDIDGD